MDFNEIMEMDEENIDAALYTDVLESGFGGDTLMAGFCCCSSHNFTFIAGTGNFARCTTWCRNMGTSVKCWSNYSFGGCGKNFRCN